MRICEARWKGKLLKEAEQEYDVHYWKGHEDALEDLLIWLGTPEGKQALARNDKLTHGGPTQ